LALIPEVRHPALRRDDDPLGRFGFLAPICELAFHDIILFINFIIYVIINQNGREFS
jgi:hypothetical protein